MTAVPDEPQAIDRQKVLDTDHLKSELGRRSVQGGAITFVAQGIKFVIHLGSTAVLARLLTPVDYGLIAIVTAVTGIVAMFKDLGLPTATVQRDQIRHEQVSTLFWINVALSIALAGIISAGAPLIAWLYGDWRLVGITLGLAVTFIISGFSAQPQALLYRQMKFTIVAVTDIAAQIIGISVGIGMAVYGFGYWSLVGLAIAAGASHLVLVWLLCRWRPSRPARGTGVRPMLRFGANLTGFQFVNYFARNGDNLLIGWRWGADVLGFYSRAYAMLMLPILQISGPITSIAVPALSRLQNDPARYRSFYLRGLKFVAGATMPVVTIMAVFAEEIVQLILGPQWTPSVVIFQMLALAAFLGPAAGTVGWLYISSGRTGRFLKWSLASSSVMVAAFLLGLPYGAKGVAFAYSIAYAAMAVVAFPIALRGTSVAVADVARAIASPVAACLIVGIAGWFVRGALSSQDAAVTLACGAAVIGTLYLLCLMIVMQQWRVYREALRHLRSDHVAAVG